MGVGLLQLSLRGLVLGVGEELEEALLGVLGLELLELSETVVLPVVAVVFCLADAAVDFSQNTPELDILVQLVQLVSVLVTAGVGPIHLGGDDGEFLHPAVDDALDAFFV